METKTEHKDMNIVDWIAAHEEGAEWPPSCEHCGKVIEPWYEEKNGIRTCHNEVHVFNCPCKGCTRNKFSHIETTEHVYCPKCDQEVRDEIHDLLATFLVYDPETGQKVK